MGIRFCKIHGAGNDFVLVRDGGAKRDWSSIARLVCARRTGVGADGLVLMRLAGKEPPTLHVSCFNADGSTASMCGNALRCAAWDAAREHGWRSMRLEMAGRVHDAVVDDTGVAVTVETAAVEEHAVEINCHGQRLLFDAAHTGTEHVVALVDDVDRVDAAGCGRLVRYHQRLAPIGANVDFAQALSDGELRIRTYERGVEAETLSCGSGAAAAVVVARHHGLVHDGPVIVHNRAGTPLTVTRHETRPGQAVWVSGPVTRVFEGVAA